MELTGVSGSSSYDQLQQLQLLKEKDKKAAEQAATESVQITAAGTATDKTSEAAVQSISQNIDTLEISPEGRAYQQNMQAPPAPVDSTASETSSTNSTKTTTVLTSLTEEEISTLVDEGTITQAEANAELARRAAVKEAEDNQKSSSSHTENPEIDDEE